MGPWSQLLPYGSNRHQGPSGATWGGGSAQLATRNLLFQRDQLIRLENVCCFLYGTVRRLLITEPVGNPTLIFWCFFLTQPLSTFDPNFLVFLPYAGTLEVRP